MPPKGKDAKGKGAKGGAPPPSTGTVTKKVLAPPDEAPMTAVAVAPPVYDPRTHAPPVVYGCFWDFPGRRPQVRPGTAPLARMTGGDPAGGAGGSRRPHGGVTMMGGAGRIGREAGREGCVCVCVCFRRSFPRRTLWSSVTNLSLTPTSNRRRSTEEEARLSLKSDTISQDYEALQNA